MVNRIIKTIRNRKRSVSFCRVVVNIVVIPVNVMLKIFIDSSNYYYGNIIKARICSGLIVQSKTGVSQVKIK